MSTRLQPALRRRRDLAEVLGLPLTPAQLAAATAPLEPGVVVAGAGSGKTTVMAARVVWLVGTGQVAPGDVLGLTFTNKAAGELATRVRLSLERLDGSLAAAATDGGLSDDVAADQLADDVAATISTYHSYAGRLVQEHGLRLGIEPSSRLLVDATRFQLVERVLRRFPGPLDHLDKTLTNLVDDVLDLDGELAEHLVSPDDLRAHDAALLARLALLPTQPADVTAASVAIGKRDELLTLVELYRAAKRRRDLVDFGDQTAFAARLAESCPEVGALERRRYRVVLLDEYQDTSVAQRRTLVGLFGHGHPVTAVGDPCQAIYGWRGASVANLDQFGVHFPINATTPARRFTLQENRRSGSKLLELANDVAASLRVRHRVDALLPCAEKQGSGDTECALFETYDDEIAWVADRVAEELAAGTSPGDIAVLVRARADFAALHGALTARDVPVEVVGLGGLLVLPEVADLVALLDVLVDPTANASLLRLLTGPRWRIGSADLVALGRHAARLAKAETEESEIREKPLDDGRLNAQLAEAVAGIDPADVPSLMEAVDELRHHVTSSVAPSRTAAVSPEARRRLVAFGAEIAELRAALTSPLLDVLHRCVQVTGLDVELAARATPEQARAEGLSTFLDVAASFADLDGDASARSFLAYLRAADTYDRGLETAAPTSADTVKLLTVHKAKGLEWDVVVLPDLTTGVFPSSRTSPRWISNGQVLPIALRGDADDLPDVTEWSTKGIKAFKDTDRARAELEERRLGYVAMTRARRLLIASGHWWGPTQKKPRGPSAFLTEVAEHCHNGNGEVVCWAEPPAPESASPVLARPADQALFPPALEPLAWNSRRRLAEDVRRRAGAPGPGPDAVADAQLPLDPAEATLVASWDDDIALLLAEHAEHDGPSPEADVRDVPVPDVLSASELLRLARDPDGLARELARPLPRRPAAAAQRGTAFHAWVESRFAAVPLLSPDDLPGAADDLEGDDWLAELQEAFLRGPYADRAPLHVEAPFEMWLDGRIIRGRIDAVYRDGDGFEVVDWKTGDSPADPLQLAVYRLAWAELAGVDPDAVSACFFHVRSRLVISPEGLADRDELARLLRTGATETTDTSAELAPEPG